MLIDTPDAGTASAADPALPAALVQLLDASLTRQGSLWSLKDVASGRYLQVNAAMAALLQRPVAQVPGCSDADLFDAGIVTALRAAEQTALSQREPLVSDHRFEWAGQRRDYSVLRMVVGAPDGGRRILCSLWNDQSAQRSRDAQLRSALEQLEQLQRANEELRREIKDQGLRDAASGLYTRSHFDDQLRREVDLSTREHREFSLVLIDVDPLSEVAQGLGEAAQTRVFEAVGRLLRGNTRAMDASCRADGTRFAVLLSGVGLATAHSRMEGLRRQCATQIVMHDTRELGFTVSMGVASFPHTAHSQEELVDACENALAEARRRGGNHVTLASIRFETN